MCHNLASSSFLGYCNKDHMERGLKLEQEERERSAKQSKEKPHGAVVQDSKAD